MTYIGRQVVLSQTFLTSTGQIVGDAPLKRGTVVFETQISPTVFLLTVDDAAFGRWKVLSTNVESYEGML